jgi:orotidine-5'-phosphate decarboxylase
VTTADEVRLRLALALDFDDLDTARRTAAALAQWIGVAKVGHELYAAAGPAAVTALREDGFRVFLDAKLHDIPTTVGRAARVLGRLGVTYLNLHAAGGEAMLRAGVDGINEGAAEAGNEPPVAIAVTVLTSDTDASAFDARLATAITAGCGGVVCSVDEIARVRKAAPGFVTIVPGVRLAGSGADDQARVGTPGAVAAAGADLLVIGRTVTAAANPQGAAREVWNEVGASLASASRV